MNEKLCLKWNDFQENVNTVFESLRQHKDFSDVTLASDDGQQFEAHKILLATLSPIFRNIFKADKTGHPHPLIFMQGVKSEDLRALIDFLYCGETKVDQENLETFLGIAEDLQLKGLMGRKDGNGIEDDLYNTETKVKPKTNVKEEVSSSTSVKKLINVSKKDLFHARIAGEQRITKSGCEAGSLQELDQKVKSMMKQSQNLTQDGSRKAYICQVCGKEGHNVAIRNHIESNHLEVSLPCNLCGKVFRSRHNLMRHKCEKASD